MRTGRQTRPRADDMCNLFTSFSSAPNICTKFAVSSSRLCSPHRSPICSRSRTNFSQVRRSVFCWLCRLPILLLVIRLIPGPLVVVVSAPAAPAPSSTIVHSAHPSPHDFPRPVAADAHSFFFSRLVYVTYLPHPLHRKLLIDLHVVLLAGSCFGMPTLADIVQLKLTNNWAT